MILWRRCGLKLAIVLALTTAGIDARCGGATLLYTGTNLSGGEFGSTRPGAAPVLGRDFIYPSAGEFDYFRSRGMNVFRIPFRWEVLQPVLNQPLVPTEVQHLKDVVKEATSRRLVVILDPHNFARYYGQVIGSPAVSVHAFGDFWRRLAQMFKNNPRVWFGIMNEPHDMPTATWIDAAAAALAAIRRTGAQNVVLVPGNGWDGAHSWIAAGNDALRKLKDPVHRMVFEAHQYLDPDNSGAHREVVSASIGRERLRQFTEWCRRNHLRAFLGEFGAASDAVALAAVDDMLRYMERSPDVWLGFTWWSAGPWWGKYMFSIEPDNGRDAPQMRTLLPHLHGAPDSRTAGRRLNVTF